MQCASYESGLKSFRHQYKDDSARQQYLGNMFVHILKTKFPKWLKSSTTFQSYLGAQLLLDSRSSAAPNNFPTIEDRLLLGLQDLKSICQSSEFKLLMNNFKQISFILSTTWKKDEKF